MLNSQEPKEDKIVRKHKISTFVSLFVFVMFLMGTPLAASAEESKGPRNLTLEEAQGYCVDGDVDGTTFSATDCADRWEALPQKAENMKGKHFKTGQPVLMNIPDGVFAEVWDCFVYQYVYGPATNVVVCETTVRSFDISAGAGTTTATTGDDGVTEYAHSDCAATVDDVVKLYGSTGPLGKTSVWSFLKGENGDGWVFKVEAPVKGYVPAGYAVSIDGKTYRGNDMPSATEGSLYCELDGDGDGGETA